MSPFLHSERLFQDPGHPRHGQVVTLLAYGPYGAGATYNRAQGWRVRTADGEEFFCAPAALAEIEAPRT